MLPSTVLLLILALVVFPDLANGLTLNMNMNAWRTKLGKSIIDTSVPNTPVEKDSQGKGAFLNKRLAGFGTDERNGPTESPEEEEANFQKLSNIDKAFRQKNLLHNLASSSSWSEAEKVSRIRMAAHVENLLPSSLSPSSIKPASNLAGGLFKDWDFDFN
jgi:hypothetical protein